MARLSNTGNSNIPVSTGRKRQAPAGDEESLPSSGFTLRGCWSISPQSAAILLIQSGSVTQIERRPAAVCALRCWRRRSLILGPGAHRTLHPTDDVPPRPPLPPTALQTAHHLMPHEERLSPNQLGNPRRCCLDPCLSQIPTLKMFS